MSHSETDDSFVQTVHFQPGHFGVFNTTCCVMTTSRDQEEEKKAETAR